MLLGIALALSMLANVALFKMRDRALMRVAAVTAERDQASAAGRQCSDATRRLRDETNERIREVARATASARALARRADARADVTLSTRPTRQDDSCASGLALSRSKLLERKR